MSSYILTCVKGYIGERDNAHARPTIINDGYAADQFLLHNPAALFKRYFRRNRDGRFTHAVGGSQIQGIETVGYSAAHNISISHHTNRNFARRVLDHWNLTTILINHHPRDLR